MTNFMTRFDRTLQLAASGWAPTRKPLACLQAVTADFIAENPFRSVIGRHLGFLRCALPGTSGRAQKSREGGGGIQDGDLITNSGFFPTSNLLRAG